MNHFTVFEGFSSQVTVDDPNKRFVDEGKAQALDGILAGNPLTSVISVFLVAIERINPNFRCLVMQPDLSSQTLNPVAAPSYPYAYVSALKHLPIEASASSIGAAAYSNKPVVVDNIFNHPNWQSLAHLARKSGIGSCWTYPVISHKRLIATLSVSQEIGELPTSEEEKLLVYAGGVVALLISRFNEYHATQTELNSLREAVEEKDHLLTETTGLLQKAISQRNEVREQLIEMENMATLGTMMSSLTHEINTPVGVAITASSYLKAAQEKSLERLNSGQLKRSELNQFYADCKEASDIIERNLLRSTEVIKTFKQLSVDQHSLDLRAFNFCDYLNEVLLSLKPKLKRTNHVFCIDVNPSLVVTTNAGAISQILINLIENAVNHAFTQDECGHLLIEASIQESPNYKPMFKLAFSDNGTGMDEETCANLYKPFFSLAKQNGGSGLGMHICYNLAVNVLQGSIACNSQLGRGTQFTILIPVSHS